MQHPHAIGDFLLSGIVIGPADTDEDAWSFTDYGTTLCAGIPDPACAQLPELSCTAGRAGWSPSRSGR